MDRRRFLVTSLAGAFAAPVAAGAQQAGKVFAIAFLGPTSSSGYASQMKAFRGGLRDLGYVERKNLVIESRSAELSFERLPALAAELVSLKLDIIVAIGNRTIMSQHADTGPHQLHLVRRTQ
jgi:putative ABC transport system substrate-binding protein